MFWPIGSSCLCEYRSPYRIPFTLDKKHSGCPVQRCRHARLRLIFADSHAAIRHQPCTRRTMGNECPTKTERDGDRGFPYIIWVEFGPAPPQHRRFSSNSRNVYRQVGTAGPCQLPTSGEPPLPTAVEPSRSSSLSDGSCPIPVIEGAPGGKRIAAIGQILGGPPSMTR